MLALCRKVARCFFGLGKAEQKCSSRAVAVSGIYALKCQCATPFSCCRTEQGCAFPRASTLSQTRTHKKVTFYPNTGGTRRLGEKGCGTEEEGD